MCFYHLQLVSEPWSVVLTLNSVTEKDLRKTCLLKNPLLVMVLLILVQLYHMIMVMVTRKLNLEKYKDIMEILKNFLGDFVLDEELWNI